MPISSAQKERWKVSVDLKTHSFQPKSLLARRLKDFFLINGWGQFSGLSKEKSGQLKENALVFPRYWDSYLETLSNYFESIPIDIEFGRNNLI